MGWTVCRGHFESQWLKADHRCGTAPRRWQSEPGAALTGITSYNPITLERGRTHDPEFENWANLVWRLGANLGTEVGLADFHKDISIDLLNEAGQLVMAFQVFRCWPSEYVTLVDLCTETNAVAIESMTLQHEGWERDATVKEPVEPK